MAEIKTLIVSDKQDLQTLLKELEEIDYQISVYTNLEQFTEAFKQDLYHFIILDLAFLGKNTSQVVQQILISSNKSKTIIWVLTDQGNIEVIEEILNLGVNDYLVWPIDKQNLKLKFLVAKKQLNTLIEHKKVEEDLKKSEKKLDLALEIANGSWWEWNCVTGQVNSHSHFGFDADEFGSYEDIKKKIHVEGRSQAEETLWKYISEKKSDFRGLEYRMQTKSGEWRWVSTNGRTVEWDQQGNPIKLIGVSLDITKYKEIEKTLRSSQDNLNRAQAVSHTGSWYLDIPNNKLEWSDETYRMFEVPPNTPLDLDIFFECVHPDDRASVQEAWQAAMAGAPYDKEHRLLVAGKLKWVRERAELEYSPDGKPLAGIGTVEDITDRKETEMRLKQFLKFFEMSLDLKCIIENGYIKELNPSFTRVLGFSKSELLAKPIIEFIFPEDRQLSLGQATILEQNKKVDEFENRYICKDGSIKWLSWNATKDSDGLRYATARDITENKQAKEALLSSNTKLLLAMDMAKLGCWELDVDSQIFTFDESLFKLYGTSSIQQGGFSISAKDYAQKFLLEEEVGIITEEIEKATTTTNPNFLGHLEHRIIRTDGSIAYIVVRYTVVKDLKGRTIKTYGINQDITDRKMIEAALEQQRSRANAIIESVSDGIISIDEHQRIIVFNHSAEKMFGCLSKDAIGQPIDKFIPVRYRRNHKEYVQEFGYTGVSTRIMGEFGSISGLRANGEEFPIEASISHSELDGRKLFTVNCRDITERKRAEEALRENEARLRAVIESEPECVKILDENCCIVDMNPAGLKMIEALSVEQIRGSSVLGLLVPEYRESFSKDVAKVFSGETIQQDFEIIGLNGRRRWMEQHAVPLWDINRVGRVKQMLAVTRDVTERKQAEDALRDSERRNRSIINALAEGIVLQDAESKILECNPSAEEILGLSYDQMMGRTSIDPRWRAIHEDGSPFPGDTHPAMVTLRTGLPQFGVIMGIHKPNGTLRWISINTQPVMQEGEKPYGVVGSFHDITERKLAEEALRESEAQLREAQKIAHLGSWIADLSNHTLTCSDEMYQIFGIDLEHFDHTEKSFFALLHPEDRDNVSKIYYDSLRNRSVFQVVHRILFSDGRVKFVQTQGVHHYNIEGQAIRSVGTVQDITERRMAEEAMIASLKEKDAMLKEIHHRVKNNLQIINSLLNIQSAQVKDAELIAAFTETKNRVRSMALLHETLYKSESFARIDLPRYVNSLCSYLCRSYGTSGGNISVLIDIAEIELDLDRAIPIGLIINELVSNALKYAFVGNNSGTIDVKLLKLDDRIVLTVKDNGKGLSKEIELHNTESLGLSLVCDLTHQLKGVIELNSNNGTVFNIRFPY